MQIRSLRVVVLALFTATIVLGGTCARVNAQATSGAGQGICTLDVSPVNFGSVRRASQVPVTVTVRCPANVPFVIELPDPAGCQAFRSFDDRRIVYEILTPDHLPWCDGTNGTGVINGIGTGTEQTYNAVAIIVSDPAKARAGGLQMQLTGLFYWGDAARQRHPVTPL